MQKQTQNIVKNKNPFGSPMIGRDFSSGNYRFGFNGKERDNEISNSGKHYDFGNRILSTDLGVWFTLDRDFRNHPFASNYRAFKDNPLIYIDPSGDNEYLAITVHQAGKKPKTVIVVLSDKYQEHQIKKQDRLGHDSYNSYVYRDIIHHETVEIDKDGKLISVNHAKTTESPDIKYTRSALTRWIGYHKFIDGDMRGKGGTQNAGDVLTSEDGGADPTKYKAAHTGKSTNNITALLAAAGVQENEVGKILEGASQIKDLTETANDLLKGKLEKKPSVDTKASKRFDTICTTCGGDASSSAGGEHVKDATGTTQIDKSTGATREIKPQAKDK